MYRPVVLQSKICTFNKGKFILYDKGGMKILKGGSENF